MAFCTNCGSQLSDDDLFCPNCGTKVLVENSVKEEVSQIQDKNTENEETSATESFYIDEKNEELQIAFVTGSAHSPNAYNSHEVHFIKAFNNFEKYESFDHLICYQNQEIGEYVISEIKQKLKASVGCFFYIFLSIWKIITI